MFDNSSNVHPTGYPNTDGLVGSAVPGTLNRVKRLQTGSPGVLELGRGPWCSKSFSVMVSSVLTSYLLQEPILGTCYQCDIKLVFV